MFYLPARGGANRANRALLEALTARGHTCHVVAMAAGRQSAVSLSDELRSKQIRAVDTDAVVQFECEGVAVRAAKGPSMLLTQALQEIREFRPAVAMVSSSTLLSPVLEQSSVRTVYIAHSPWELPFGCGRAFEDPSMVEAIRSVNGIIAVSNDLQQRIRAGSGREASVIPFPVYGKGPFPPLGRFKEGFVTMINPCVYKGISIFSTVARRRSDLAFAAVPSWATTGADIDRLNELPNVTLLPAADQITPILAQTRVLLVPSLWPEGFPLITIEAMLHGIPVIASDSGGLSEAKLGIDYVLPVRPIERYEPRCDERGLPIAIVPEQNANPWVEAVTKLTSDRQHYEALSSASRDAALRFVSRLIIDPFEAYLEKVARTPPEPRPSHGTRVPDSSRSGLRARIDHLPATRRALLAARLRAPREKTFQCLPILPLPRRPGVNLFPLSFAQQRLWFVEQLEPADAHYRPPQVIHLGGPLDVEALHSSINEVIRRHEVLRTSFPVTGDGPMQKVAPELSLPFNMIDLRRYVAAEKETRLKQVIEREAQRPFDLVNGPLIHTQLLRAADEEHVLLLSIHHLVSDGWSLGILFRELESLYNASVRREPVRLPELPIQYADFAVWQRQYLTGEVLAARLAYWKGRLGPEMPAPDLPTDRSRPPVQTYAGASRAIELTAALTRGLKALSEREGATLFMVLLAAFEVLLHRLSGQAHVTVGSPIAGRNNRQIEGLIGLFVNALVLRTDMSGNPTFRELLRRVRDVALGAYAYQDLPFEKLVEELRPERDLSRGPLFQVFFNMLNYDEERLNLHGLTTTITEPPKREARYDLTLYAREHGEHIGLNLLFNTDLFDEIRMVEMLTQLEHLLGQIVHDPDGGIRSFSLVTQSAGAIIPDPTCALCHEPVGSLCAELDRTIRRSGGNTAIVDCRRTISYAEFSTSTDRIAHRLRANGVGLRDVAVIHGDRGAALVTAVVGTLKSGAAFALLDPACPRPRRAAQVAAIRPRAWIEVAPTHQLPGNLGDTVSTIPCHIRLTPGLRDLGDSRAVRPVQGFAATVDADDPAYIAFTSGTTGPEPKAIRGTHKPLVHFLRWHCRTFDLKASDRFSMLSGLSHDPLLRDMFTPLWLGATLYIPDPAGMRDPRYLADWMRVSGITVAHVTPALVDMLTANAGDGRAACIPSLRYLFFAGDTLTAQTVKRAQALAPNATFVNYYGTTETPQAMSYYVVPAAHGGRECRAVHEALPIGRGIEGVQLLILNDAGAQGGIGELGEVCVRTPYLSQGYINDGQLTARKFIRNPFTAEPDDRIYRTGDLGRYHPSGTIDLCGRADRQIKIRGFRIEPAEIEAALTRCDAVREAVVTVAGNSGASPTLAAYVVLTDNVSTLSLRGQLRGLLPEHMIPARFCVLDTIPLTPNGKVDYARLEDMSCPERDARDFVPPSTAMQHQIAEIWRRALGVERVGLDDNFFDLGGHSLLAVKVAAQMEKKTGVRVPFRAFFSQTLGQFVASCEQAFQSKAGAYAGD